MCYLKVVRGEDGKPVIKSFATGKTLGGRAAPTWTGCSSSPPPLPRRFTVCSKVPMPDTADGRQHESGGRGAPSQSEGATGTHGCAAGNSGCGSGGTDDEYGAAPARMTAASRLYGRGGRRPLRIRAGGTGRCWPSGIGELYAFSSLAVQITKRKRGQPAGRGGRQARPVG